MDLAQALRQLSRHRGWVALGLLVAAVAGLSTAYRISVLPPDLSERALSYGTANTQVLVDTPTSALTDLGPRLDPLTQRAAVFTRLARTRPVQQAIAREAGTDERTLVVEAPIQSNEPNAATEPTAERRSDNLLDEDRRFRVIFERDRGLPAVNVFARAPRAEDAVRLADAGAAGFIKYIEAVQRRQQVPPERRVTLRQLGAATGGQIAGDINLELAVLVFAGIAFAWAVLILVVSGVADNMRKLREAEETGLSDAPTTS